jgi:hypothetical protein
MLLEEFYLHKYNEEGLTANEQHRNKTTCISDSSTQPSIQCVPGALSPGVKLSRCEVDHSPPTRAKVKKKKKVDVRIHSSIRLHGIVLN